MHLQNIAWKQLNNLQKHLLANGLIVRQKKSGGRQERTALSFETCKDVVSHIRNYAETHALSLPERIPGFRNFNISLLPSNCSKQLVYNEYSNSMPADTKPISLRSFLRLWRQLLPYILIAKPATDLCWTCQSNNTLILR